MKAATAELVVLRGEVERLRKELEALKSKPLAQVVQLVPKELAEPRKPPKRAPARMPPPLLEEARAEMRRPMTQARAARLRQMHRRLCGCDRCQYAARDAETPALTFAEHERRRAEWAQVVATPDRHVTLAEILKERATGVRR